MEKHHCFHQSFHTYAVLIIFFSFSQLYQDFLSVWLTRESVIVLWVLRVPGTAITPLCAEDFIYAKKEDSAELGQHEEMPEDSGYRLATGLDQASDWFLNKSLTVLKLALHHLGITAGLTLKCLNKMALWTIQCILINICVCSLKSLSVS